MESALIGLCGVLIGILVNEHLRRNRRIEEYASSVFKRRLEVHEELYAKIQQAYPIATDLIETPDYTTEERHAIASKLIIDMAHFMDSHSLYLSENVCMHCGAMFIGVENYHNIEDTADREQQVKHFWNLIREAKDMIRAESGFQQFDKLFGIVTKPKYQSAIAEYARERRKELKREGKI